MIEDVLAAGKDVVIVIVTAEPAEAIEEARPLSQREGGVRDRQAAGSDNGPDVASVTSLMFPIVSSTSRDPLSRANLSMPAREMQR
jgi:hypothetical protein